MNGNSALTAVAVEESSAAHCFRQLVSIERAQSSLALARSLQGVVEANGCARGAIVIADLSPDGAGIPVIWRDATSVDAAEAVAAALLPVLKSSSGNAGEMSGSWSPNLSALKPAAAKTLCDGWGSPHFIAISITRIGSSTAWLLLGGRRDESDMQFAARITQQRAECLRLLVTALAIPIRGMLERQLGKLLSNSHRDIVAKMAEGMRPAAIAAARGAAEATVRNQIARIRRRLRAASDAEAVAIALRLGLI